MGPNYYPGWGESMSALGPVLALIILAVSLLSIALTVLVWWRIFSKAGYSGALGLLILVPIANLIAMLVLAFSTWPIEEELRRLRGAGRDE